MRPGQTSTELRWRIGSWMVGSAILGVLSSVFWKGSTGFAFLCLAGGLLGVLLANPFRLVARIRGHTIAEPVFRLRPLGVIGFIIFLIFLLVPYAIGDWLMTLVGERFLAGREPIPDEDTIEDDPLEGYDTMFTPARRPMGFGRWRMR